MNIDSEAGGKNIPEPRLKVNVKGKWESYSPAARIRMDFSSNKKEDMVKHLEALSRTYQFRLKHSEALFLAAHREYNIFRTMQWALIMTLIVSIFGIIGFGLTQEWFFGYILATMLIPCCIILPVIYFVNKKRNNLGTILVRYLENYHKHDPISDTLLKVWAIDYVVMKTEDMEFRMEDAFKKELEDEIVRTILFLSTSQKISRLTQEEEKIINSVLILLPSDVNQTITKTLNQELYQRITTEKPAGK